MKIIKKIGLLGYCCESTNAVFGNENKIGAALLNINHVIKDITALKNIVDFVVIHLHWGDEEIKFPKKEDVDKARMFVEAGADLIIGHHAHVIQSMEIYKGKYICYGIGNFIFPNFDVQSNFNGEMFLERAVKIQRNSNKESILVELDKDLEVSIKTLKFDGLKVQYSNVDIPRKIPRSKKSYESYKMMETKKIMIQLFLDKPRIPTIKQLKLMLGKMK